MDDIGLPIPSSAIPKTLSQSVYKHLKQAILSNKLKAGQKLNEKEISKLLEVSATPVREALFILAAEGLITIKSHKEVVVKELSHKELTEIFQVLSILESYAVVNIMDSITDADLQEIEDLQVKMARYCKKTTIEKYCELNKAIHLKLWEFVTNEFLNKTLHSVHDQFQRYSDAQYYALGMPGALKKSFLQHEEILNALKSKNKRKLKSLLEKHWGASSRLSSFKKGLTEYLNNEKGPGEKI
jgi:DNA-binding GntR family transcriptional regulator